MYQLVLATQPCTLALTTGYRVYRLVLATQPSTLHSLVLLLQQLVTECTDQYLLHSLVLLLQHWLQSVPAGTGYTALYTLAIGYIWLQPTGYKSTDRVLPTQSLLYSASPNWLHKLLNIDQWLCKFVGDPSLPVFCQLQRITVYSKLQVMETWYRAELPKVNLVT